MALTTSEIDILRFIQKHKAVTPAAYITGMNLGEENRVTIRKAMMRLEEQGFLTSDGAGARVRSYRIGPNVSKVDFNKMRSRNADGD